MRLPFSVSAGALLALTLAIASPERAMAQAAAPGSPATGPNAPAEQAYKQGEFDKVVQLTNTTLRSNPNDHVALYLRGSARVEQGLQRRDGQLIRDGIADAREAIRLGGKENSIYYLPYLYGMTQL
jgi:hypothetical protein